LYRNVSSAFVKLSNTNLSLHGTSSGEIWTGKFAPFVNNNNINAIFTELSEAMYHIEQQSQNYFNRFIYKTHSINS
jgi:hypothetical protein